MEAAAGARARTRVGARAASHCGPRSPLAHKDGSFAITAGNDPLEAEIKSWEK